MALKDEKGLPGHFTFDSATVTEMAKQAWPGFVEAMHRATGSVIDPGSEPILKNVFVNGYICAHRDFARMFAGQIIKPMPDPRLSN